MTASAASSAPGPPRDGERLLDAAGQRYGTTIIGENTVQMIGVSGPTPARICRSASSCSPSAPAGGSAGCRRRSSAAPAHGACVRVYGTARSPEAR
jgi:hypothetical protein